MLVKLMKSGVGR